jgi:hypothetical protein
LADDTVEGVPVDSTMTGTAAAQADVEKAVMDDLMSALNQQADQARKYYEKLAKQIKQVASNATTSLGDKNMAEVMTPGMIMGMGNGGGDGLFGGGGGGGLIGGLILGSLLRNGGNLLGNEGAGAAAALRSPPEQAAANMALMQSIGMVDKAVAVNAAAFEASQSAQSLGLTNQLNSQTSSLAGRIADVNQNIMENRYELSKDISADGEKTRALITQQYELNLQRQLADANAAIIELRGENRLTSATNGINVTNTNNINQMQQQTQQQQQYGQLANMIWGLGQQIRSTNEAINVGSGTLTASPTNTNTNIR